MATILRVLPRSVTSNWIRAAFSTTTVHCAEDPANALTHKEAPIIDSSLITAKPEEKLQKTKLQGYISVPTAVNLSPISGIPEEHIKGRRVRIYIPSKNAMQSGTDNIQRWEMEFETRERWENPLMGWSSSGDPLSNIKVEFNNKEEAIEFCERNGWRWFVDGEEKAKKKRVKNYGVNFSWNKRTRVSTK